MPATAPRLTEHEVLKQCLAMLKAHGCQAKRQNTGAWKNPAGRLIRFGSPGDADIAGWLPGGKALACEVKAEGWKPRNARDRERLARQIAKLNELNRAGGAGLLVDHPRVLATVLPWVLKGARVHVRECGTMEISKP